MGQRAVKEADGHLRYRYDSALDLSRGWEQIWVGNGTKLWRWCVDIIVVDTGLSGEMRQGWWWWWLSCRAVPAEYLDTCPRRRNVNNCGQYCSSWYSRKVPASAWTWSALTRQVERRCVKSRREMIRRQIGPIVWCESEPVT